MAQRRRRGRKPDPKPGPFSDLSPGTKRGIWAVIFVVFGIILLLGAIDAAGVVGTYVKSGSMFMVGIGYYLLPVLLFALAYTFLNPREDSGVSISRTVGAVLFFLAALAAIEIGVDTKGGLVGNLLATPMVSLVGLYAAIITLVALVVIGFLLTFNVELGMPSFSLKKKEVEGEGSEDALPEDSMGPEDVEEPYAEEEYYEEPAGEGAEDAGPSIADRLGLSKKKNELLLSADYTPPPLSLLEKDRGKAGVGDVKANANLIKRTLQNFNIQVEVDEVSIGPSVTRYALKPAEGVRLQKILGLQNNLELALAAHPIRIEAPIPGKSLVGVEVPNSTKSMLGLASLLGLF